MQTTIASNQQEVRRLAKQLYENGIRQEVESAENVGKMLIIDVETGDFEVDKNGLEAAFRLNERHVNTRLFGIRIGYNVSASIGGVMERVYQ